MTHTVCTDKKLHVTFFIRFQIRWFALIGLQFKSSAIKITLRASRVHVIFSICSFLTYFAPEMWLCFWAKKFSFHQGIKLSDPLVQLWQKSQSKSNFTPICASEHAYKPPNKKSLECNKPLEIRASLVTKLFTRNSNLLFQNHKPCNYLRHIQQSCHHLTHIVENASSSCDKYKLRE